MRLAKAIAYRITKEKRYITIKPSYPVSMLSRFTQMSAFSGDLEKNLKIVIEIGYSVIELLVQNPKEVSVEIIRILLDKYNLELSAIGTNPM